MPFFLLPLLINLLIGVGLQVLGYLLMPKPKSDKTQEVTDMDNPTAEGGRPIPVVFGEMWVTGVNIIWFGDKATTTRQVDA
ncbi:MULTISPECIES: hypothetical protein [unclassified Mesorhizobium]|uniref:hypothetical protein n=1 Tax=unclassified Mesorhizobium TaxID=325217 RepID=UPI0010938D16|nr:MULTISPECIES: hypothetical protein [unclassified Mesorhizobium]TGT90915.1 hypothetical protein EN804_06155 [Mesorhizobium sp. M8A.F.Ca.ET.161.01.1.1]TGV43805.1 hypothetical protein EN785_07390 [Mesorhizobium sp. M8A.F.Ca.ET.142.01.1.1]TGV97357.1 hypothetical protein EN788_56055 [Mesorhizobium sp. M2D.F.Ca.ET.145.01.1.1]